MGVINAKEYKISNAKIKELVNLAGLSGGFLATLNSYS